jgi:hypothetical protein
MFGKMGITAAVMRMRSGDKKQLNIALAKSSREKEGKRSKEMLINGRN